MPNASRRAVVPLVIAAAALAAGACSGGGHQAAVAKCDAPPGDSAYGVAALEYIKGLQPTPMRFLTAVSTDSALPDAAREALSHKQPTYLFPKDPAGQAVVMGKLKSVGSWPTLLVTWRGVQRVDDGTTVFHLGGHYLLGQDSGKAAPRRAIYFNCDTARWHYARTEEERTS